MVFDGVVRCALRVCVVGTRKKERKKKKNQKSKKHPQE
jgi:hypothetical protein